MPRYFGFFQEVIISNFFGEANPESPFQHQDGIKNKLKKKDLKRSNSNCKGIRVS